MEQVTVENQKLRKALDELKSRLVLNHEKESALDQLVATDPSPLAADIRAVLRGEPALGVRQQFRERFTSHKAYQLPVDLHQSVEEEPEATEEPLHKARPI